jgi:hypothetical protein
MAFQKGHKLGRGNSNSGRKSKLEEVQRALTMHKEKVTSEALIELASSLGFSKLKDLQDSGEMTLADLQTVIMPILLKGLTEKKDLTSGGKPLILPATLIDKNNLDATNAESREDCDIQKEI